LTQTPEAIVEDLKSEKKFDLRSALSKVSYPTEDVTVYLDGHKAHELNVILDKIADLEHKAQGLTAQAQGSMVDDPEKEGVDAEIADLKVQEAALIKEISASALTFTMRGVAPAVWRLIDKEARRKIKPNTKSEEDQYEAQLERNQYVNNELIAKGTVKITNAEGVEDNSAVTAETAEALFDVLLETEFMKLKSAIENLTFAHTLFQNVALQDADFLSKSSDVPDSQATSE
jgi:hypothetical protein